MAVAKLVTTPKGQRELVNLDRSRTSNGDISRYILLKAVNRKQVEGISPADLAKTIMSDHPKRGMPLNIARKMVRMAKTQGLIRAK